MCNNKPFMAAIGAAMCATALLFSATAQAQAPSPAQTASGTRLVLLGTAGGPSIIQKNVFYGADTQQVLREAGRELKGALLW